jgi:hypothetical protein
MTRNAPWGGLLGVLTAELGRGRHQKRALAIRDKVTLEDVRRQNGDADHGSRGRSAQREAAEVPVAVDPHDLHGLPV